MPTVENHESSQPQLIGYDHVYAEFQFQEFGIRSLIKRVCSVMEHVQSVTERCIRSSNKCVADRMVAFVVGSSKMQVSVVHCNNLRHM